MKQQPFSVCMCVYGKDDPAHFEAAVHSIMQQTSVPDEVVLVVDGPVPENLETIITEYEKMESFRVIRLAENQGHGNARRVGLENCTHELVALMDADDISVPERFEKQLHAICKDLELSIIGGTIAEFFDEPNNVIAYRTVAQSDSQIKKVLKKRCPFNQMTVMFRKEHVMRAGGYKDWFCNEDYYLWIRMYMAGAKFANIPDILVNVRVGADMYRRRGGWKYFFSEFKLQNYMLRNRVIRIPVYVANVAKRFVVQVLLPNRLRGWVFQKFAREKTVNG